MNNKIRRQGLFFGTIVLLISNIFVKGLGFAYRVILVRLLGAEGIGLVEMASPFFSFLLVIAGCGIQPALSQLIAGRGRDNERVYFRTALVLLTSSSLAVTAAGYALLPLLVRHFVSDQRIALCLQTILPAIFIIGVASAWRGVFQGTRQVTALGMSQNIEQVTRVIIGVWLASRLLGLGLETAAAAPSAATVCGELTGFLYLVLRHKWGERRRAAPAAAGRAWLTWREFRLAARDLLSYGWPVTLGRMAASAIMMVQALLIPLCLQWAGFDTRSATEIYGRFSGVALTLLHLPGVFTAALSVSVLPAVAESSLNEQDRPYLHKNVSDSLAATVIFTLPGMLLLFLFADDLCVRLFDSAPAAAILRVLAPCGIFFYLQVTLASVLQGLGAVRRLLANGIISGMILLLGIYLLTPLPALGIIGAAIAADAAWVCGFLLNLIAVRQKARLRLVWRELAAKPLLAAAAGIAAFLLLRQLLPYNNATALVLFIEAVVTVLVYTAVLALCGGFRILRRHSRK